ncbi:MAG: iron chelate uptake ABC transporter family permease subunit, partial [Clostridia bacterium]|nr:iron chelate uptake ABC transporter family permease subunit [Clostridia bacterium]
MNRKKSNTAVFLFAAGVFCVVVLAALFWGGTHISFDEAVRGIFGKGSGNVSVIMRSVRLPRVAASVIAGAGLSVSGVLLQAVTDNGLASPNIIGINSGAGFLTIIFLFFFPKAVGALPVAAFCGAFCA